MRNKLIAFTLAAALALLAAGCMERAADEVSETVSQAKSELENAGSRLEEAGSPGGFCRGIHAGPGLLPQGRVQRHPYAPAQIGL